MPIEALGGDATGGASGAVTNVMVVGLGGRALSASAPAVSSVLRFDGAQWSPAWLPGGAYGHVQYNNGSGFFGGYGEFWYNGNLHVGLTYDTGTGHRLQIGGGLWLSGDMDCQGDIWTKSPSVTVGFAYWDQPFLQEGRGRRLISISGADFRTRLDVYSKGETWPRGSLWSRAEADARFVKLSDMGNYYTKAQTYSRAEVYNKTEVDSLAFSNFYTRTQIDSMITQYARRTHYHLTDYNNGHNHGGAVPQGGGHYHGTSSAVEL